MAGIIKWTSDTLKPGLKAFPAVFHVRLDVFMDHEATKVQDYMRSNAPWTDRTSNARNGLFARATSGGVVHSIVAYHTVPYGIWLEVRHSGKYAIITPTIQYEGQRIMKDLQGFLGRMARL